MCESSISKSITRSDAFEPKGINYRMSPENGPCLSAAGLDCCVLANNHVLDWGPTGLIDTLNALQRLRIKTAGAGRNLAEANALAIVEIPNEGRLLVGLFRLNSILSSGLSRSRRSLYYFHSSSLHRPVRHRELLATLGALDESCRRPG